MEQPSFLATEMMYEAFICFSSSIQKKKIKILKNQALTNMYGMHSFNLVTWHDIVVRKTSKNDSER